ncbi:M1 family aminopeptidase [Hymenobacter sp. H14-R3]|uniref:M1 family aminopeptidase n=1 Tax=Hymenobacter sp. H14-R3 TaxID=3046308 RepID=UPI0024BA8681|nr:M1 family aminopeptidase [Hymenobacter sp. H14-R3]MDJ0365557.1 M1 family aminopeptidase [Hymenobacter sp. H14-R3]
MLSLPKYSWLLVLFLWGGTFASLATPIVHIRLRVEPGTHSFTCHYQFTLPASDTTSVVRLNLNHALNLQRVHSTGALQQRVSTVTYVGDTVHQVQVRYGPHRRRRQIELVYSGTMAKGEFTDQVAVFSGHGNWLPFRPYAEYELVAYELVVQAPAAYQVRSTTAAVRQRPGEWVFHGTTSHIEPTAFVAQHFYQATSATAPPIALVKAGAPLARPDTVLLHRAEAIVAFYNRTIGRQAPVGRFTILLPGTNSGAYGLLDDATVITYSTFDVTSQEDLLILAHEISHKWWAYGSFHDENGWLSEAFATYSSLLYLQASGDEAGYRAELARLAASAAGTPPLWGFDRYQHPFAMYRRVIYNKGTGILAALHQHVGTEQFMTILAQTAAQQTSTTTGFLATVAQVAGPGAHAWLLAELKR